MSNSHDVLSAIDACDSIKLVYRRCENMYQYKYKVDARVYNDFVDKFCIETCLAVQCDECTSF